MVKCNDGFGGFDAGIDIGDQCNPHIAFAGVAVFGIARQKAAGQHLDGGFLP